MAYVELHARSAFSFLRGGSNPETLAREAAQRGLGGLALCDRDGVYGAVRAHLTAKDAGLRAWVGAEITLEDDTVVPVLAATRRGYQRLCALLSVAGLRAPKGEGRVTWSELAADNDGLIALTGDEEGPVRRAWEKCGPQAAGEVADNLLGAFGADRLQAEVQRHLIPGEEAYEGFLIDWARARGVPLLATNGVIAATPDSTRVNDVFTCLREHTTLAQAGRLLAPNRERHLKSPRAMAALFADLPEAVANTARLAERLEFTLDHLGYRFPDFAVPADFTQEGYLREVTWTEARARYGTLSAKVRAQLERELELIGRLGFSGYFLIVWDLCAFARREGILVQGRGSAANSAVCYALGITAVDPIENKLLFERFLNEGRTDWPDIDLDLPSGEPRERMIQELYRRYGRTGAAMTANVISYRARSTMREVGKVMGLPDDVLDRFGRLFHGGDFPPTLKLAEQLRLAGLGQADSRLPVLVDTCRQIEGLPRHLGQHSGGMVLCAGPLHDYVPVENARMPGRSVLQWDKSDCEDMGIIKVDLLGLGMMAALSDCLEICAQRNEPVDLARLPKDDAATFAMMQEADTIGVFQVESRAQMATLPRLKPACFYDVAVQVAIIRPGPIQGDAVNPYLERRAGRQPITYPDPRAKPILERTLGVVLFQEQALSLAMDLGGFTAAQADELRRAIGFTRSPERLEGMKTKLEEALLRNTVSSAATESILQSLASFALYGFPESHALSFALLAYASVWMKVHRPAAFYAALLNNQPMGFYRPATLVQDAKRHGIRVLPVCVARSGARCQVEESAVIRLGLNSLKGLRERSRERILAARPFGSSNDLFARVPLAAEERRVLAAAGALHALSANRREALWQAEAAWGSDDLFARGDRAEPSPLPAMNAGERLLADYTHTAMTVGSHPMKLRRPHLSPKIWSAERLEEARPGQRVQVAGTIICRQRPGTAKGICFVTMEDETGLTNAIVRPELYERERLTLSLEPAVIITGKVQRSEGVVHVIAERIAALPDLPNGGSHDWH